MWEIFSTAFKNKSKINYILNKNKDKVMSTDLESIKETFDKIGIIYIKNEMVDFIELELGKTSFLFTLSGKFTGYTTNNGFIKKKK